MTCRLFVGLCRIPHRERQLTRERLQREERLHRRLLRHLLLLLGPLYAAVSHGPTEAPPPSYVVVTAAANAADAPRFGGLRDPHRPEPYLLQRPLHVGERPRL